jgi:hypothetical protein
MFIKEDINNYSQHEQKQNKQISSLSINSLSTSNEQINSNNDKTQSTFPKPLTKEPSYSYEYSKTRTNTNSHLKRVTFLNPLVQIINVRSYKKYNKLPSLRKNRQSYYDFGQDNIICKCITI